jgi:hypothetical protein
VKLYTCREITVCQRAEGACQAAEGTFYPESLIQEASHRPFVPEQIKVVGADTEKRCADQNSDASKKNYFVLHFLASLKSPKLVQIPDEPGWLIYVYVRIQHLVFCNRCFAICLIIH